MNRDEFLKELTKEGLLIYGTTWESNLKRLKEIKKYRDMWEEVNNEWGNHLVSTNYDRWTCIRNIMKTVKQKYFPKPQKTVLTLEVESLYKDCIENNLKEIYGFINSANGGAVEEFHGHITLTGVKDV